MHSPLVAACISLHALLIDIDNRAKTLSENHALALDPWLPDDHPPADNSPSKPLNLDQTRMGTPPACCTTPAEDEQLVIACYCVELAGALEDRHRHTRQLHNAERQVELFRDALKVLPMSHAYYKCAPCRQLIC